MNEKIKDQNWERLNKPLLFLFFLGIALVYHYRLRQDFWGDELYTIKHFVLVPLLQSLSDYHVPNNHIFFNFLNNLYLKLIGVSDLNTLLQKPWTLRILPYAYTLGLFATIYYYCRKLYSRTNAWLCLLLLAGSIPFFNFALQIRGYTLSGLFLSLAYFESIYYQREQKFKNLLATLLFAAFSVYTVLTSIYPVFLLLLYWNLHYLINWLRSKNKIDKKHFNRFFLASLASAILILLMYLPIFGQLLGSKYLKVSSPFLYWQIEFYLPHMKQAWISGRWLVIILMVLAIPLAYKRLKHYQSSIYLLLLLATGPILISYFRGDHAPLRTFVPLFPLASILMGLLVGTLLERIKNKGWKTVSMVVLLLYCSWTFYSELTAINKTLKKDVAEGHIRQFLYHQFYNAAYFPLEASREFAKEHQPEEPVIILGCQEHGIPHYLELFDIPYLEEKQSLKAFDSLRAVGSSFYIVSSYPNQVPVDKGDKMQKLSSELSYHTFLHYQNH